MSKVLTIPIAVMAAPFVIAAGAAGLAAKTAKAVWGKLASNLGQDFLLPLGADDEQLRLEAATVSYRPFEGIDFVTALPAIEVPATGSLALPSANRMDEAGSLTPAQEEAYKQVEAAAQTVGFQTERRALPPGSSVLVFDLIGLEQALDRRDELVPVTRRPS